MAKRNTRQYVEDIRVSIARIEKHAKDLTKEKFLKDIDEQDVIIRRLEIIGEAARHIPETIKDKHPNIEWKKITGARDIFAHGYFIVKLSRVWNIIQKDIPKLKKQIKKLLEE